MAKVVIMLILTTIATTVTMISALKNHPRRPTARFSRPPVMTFSPSLAPQVLPPSIYYNAETSSTEVVPGPHPAEYTKTGGQYDARDPSCTIIRPEPSDFPQYSSHIIVITSITILPRVRTALGMETMFCGAPVFVVLINMPKWVHTEMANVANVIVFREHVAPSQFEQLHPSTLQIIGLNFAIQRFPHVCFLLIDVTSHVFDDWSHVHDNLVRTYGIAWSTVYPVLKRHIISRVECQDRWVVFEDTLPNRFPLILVPANNQHWHVRIQQLAEIILQSSGDHETNHDITHIKLLDALQEDTEFWVPLVGHANGEYDARHPIRLNSFPSERLDFNCFTHHIMRSHSIVPVNVSVSDNRTSICFAIPTMGSKKMIFWTEHSLFRGTLSSMAKSFNHTKRLFARRLYIGWEQHDVVIGGYQALRALRREIMTMFHDANMDVRFIRHPNTAQDIAYIWNSLFMAAFDDGCDYLFHLTDDADFTTQGVGDDWDRKFVDLLRANNNFGEIGSKKVLNTMPFVHRTHMEIFGAFYPSLVHNVMCDTIVWLLYRSVGGMVGPHDMEHWINLSDGTDSKYSFCALPRPLEYTWPNVQNLFGFSQKEIVKYAITHNIMTREIEALNRVE